MPVIPDRALAEHGGTVPARAAAAQLGARLACPASERDRISLQHLPDDALAEVLGHLHVRFDANAHAQLHATAHRFRVAEVAREPYAAARLIAKATRGHGYGDERSGSAFHEAVVHQRGFTSHALRAEILQAAASRIGVLPLETRGAAYDAVLAEVRVLEPSAVRAPVLTALAYQAPEPIPDERESGRRHDETLAQVVPLPATVRAAPLAAVAYGLAMLPGAEHDRRYAELIAATSALPPGVRAYPVAMLADQLSAVSHAERPAAAHATLAALGASHPAAARAPGLMAVVAHVRDLPAASRASVLAAVLDRTVRLPPTARAELLVLIAEEISRLEDPADRLHATTTVTAYASDLPPDRRCAPLGACAALLRHLPPGPSRSVCYRRLLAGLEESGPPSERAEPLGRLANQIWVLDATDRATAYDGTFAAIGRLPEDARAPELEVLAGQIAALPAADAAPRFAATGRAIAALPVDGRDEALEMLKASVDALPEPAREPALRDLAVFMQA